MKKAAGTRNSSVQPETDHTDNKKSASKRSRSNHDEDMWDCSFCTYKNRPVSNKCEMCSVAKGSSTRRPRLTQIAQQFAKIESQMVQDRKKEKRKETLQQKIKTPKHSSTSSISNASNLTNVHTIPITVKGITVFMTEYEVSECGSLSTSTTNNTKGHVPHNNASEDESDHDGTVDDIPKVGQSESGTHTDDTDSGDNEYLEKSANKKNATSSKKTNKTPKTNTNKRKHSISSDTTKPKKSKSTFNHSLNESFESSFDLASPTTSTTSSANKPLSKSSKKSKGFRFIPDHSRLESSDTESVNTSTSTCNKQQQNTTSNQNSSLEGPVDKTNKKTAKTKLQNREDKENNGEQQPTDTVADLQGSESNLEMNNKENDKLNEVDDSSNVKSVNNKSSDSTVMESSLVVTN